MILKGFALAAGGFLFIFSPGLPMSLISRRSPAVKRDLVYWGMLVWLAALLPSIFIQSLLRQILLGSQTPGTLPSPAVLADYAMTLIGALLTAFFVTGAMMLVLGRQKSDTALLPNGLALGFGVGLVAQLFTGLSLVGAGFRLMFGDTSSPTLAGLAQTGFFEILVGLLPLVLFRPALLSVSALQGVLAGRALRESWKYFWLAIFVNTIFVWAITAFQLVLGGNNAGEVLVGHTDLPVSAVTALYYLLAFGLAMRWLFAQIKTWAPEANQRK
ncbi:MAG: hypothetical protein EHM70_00270 [Chloroflexota bacterium]|nr:MAG: hypothetical protein EHM70_00270 [Chloroflexota bacterium]